MTTGNYVNEEFLAHYGVKGMKWGVHRTDPTTLSKAERKEAKSNIKKLIRRSIDTKYETDLFDRKLTKKQYDRMGTRDHIVKKGSTVNRITYKPDEKFKGITFVSSTKSDKNLYRAMMPVVNSKFSMGGSKTYKKTYEATYRSLETLRSPSEKARVDAFSELMDSHITLKNGKIVTGRELLRKAGAGRHVKTLDAQRLGLEFYNQFTETQYMDTPLNSAYFNKLKARGYNAIIDDNDRGHVSQAPLILLNPNGSIKKMSLKELSADDINNAQRLLRMEDLDGTRLTIAEAEKGR